MKTKNRYKRSRMVLFIGLLSFHALSSCVNTGGQLGVDKKSGKRSVTKGLISSPSSKMSKSKEEEAFIQIINKYRLYKSVPWYKKPKYVWGLVGAAALLAGTMVSLYYLSVSSFTNETGNNATVGNNQTRTEMSSNSTAFEDINETQTELPGNNVTSQSINQAYIDTNTIPFSNNIPIRTNSNAIIKVMSANYSIESIDQLLRTENIDVKDGDNATLLIRAALVVDVKTLEYVINKGADIEARNSGRVTALMNAAAANDPDKVRVLLKHKANPLIMDKNNDTAEYYASLKNTYTDKEKLRQHNIKKQLNEAKKAWGAKKNKHKREVSNSLMRKQLNQVEKNFNDAQKNFAKMPTKR